MENPLVTDPFSSSSSSPSSPSSRWVSQTALRKISAVRDTCANVWMDDPRDGAPGPVSSTCMQSLSQLTSSEMRELLLAIMEEKPELALSFLRANMATKSWYDALGAESLGRQNHLRALLAQIVQIPDELPVLSRQALQVAKHHFPNAPESQVTEPFLLTAGNVEHLEHLLLNAIVDGGSSSSSRFQSIVFLPSWALFLAFLVMIVLGVLVGVGMWLPRSSWWQERHPSGP
mmetsp:Transcript_10961/g.28744  ORF Transcript_10961/g.28744 Transcript_10961/m.28744 type:complete len:231 (-) Transcript_10961:1041-1733(-)